MAAVSPEDTCSNSAKVGGGLSFEVVLEDILGELGGWLGLGPDVGSVCPESVRDESPVSGGASRH
eukprot:5243052-Prorocentrum_lima.AAC.1